MSNLLRIRAADTTAEISVFDGSFALVATGLHELERELPRGIYKVRVQVGPTLRERMVSLDGDQPLEFGSAEIVSPVPLGGHPHEANHHAEAAMRASRNPKATLGEGGSALVFVRDQGRGTGAGADGNPASGLSLRRWGADDDRAIDVAALADVRMEGAASAGLSVDAAPGLYVLAMTEAGGRTVEQPLHVSAGYQTQVFLMRERPAGDAATPAAELARASIVISAGPFQPCGEQIRLAEIARYALIHDRKILSGRLRAILRGELEDPMLGLIGAHLMLRDEPHDAACIRAIVAKVAALIGADHPDVRALTLRTSTPGESGGAITSPPMLKAGWDLVVAASTRRPGVIAPRSPAAAAATLTLPGGPWMAWVGGPSGAKAEREAAIAGIIDDYAEARTKGLLARGAVAREPATAAAGPAKASTFEFFDEAGRFARLVAGFDGVAKSPGAARDAKGSSEIEALDALLPRAKSEFVRTLTVDEKADLSLALGVPSDALTALLAKVSD